MKRIIVFILVVCALSAFCSCNKQEDIVTDPGPKKVTKAEDEIQDESMGESEIRESDDTVPDESNTQGMQP